jgi:hypothetical protein
MLQPVIQLGAAIHCKGFSGGALNRFQKLMHVSNLLTVLREKSRNTIGILANRPIRLGVTSATPGLSRSKYERSHDGEGRVSLLIRGVEGTCA